MTRKEPKNVPELEARVVKLYLDEPDIPIPDIARRFGISIATVHNFTRAHKNRQTKTKLIPGLKRCPCCDGFYKPL